MIETVLFDLDGTIVDSNELIMETFIHVIQNHASKPLTREEIIPYMGQTLELQLQQFSGWEDVSELTAAYRQYNTERHDALIKEFPHVREVIEELYAHGIKLGVVTTKIRETTERALDMFHLSSFMDTVVTFSDVEQPKPHPEPVLKAIAALGANPATTLMVGDSPADIMSANAAGAISVAVGWSLKGAEFLQQYEPKHVIHDMRDLYQIIGLERNP